MEPNPTPRDPQPQPPQPEVPPHPEPATNPATQPEVPPNLPNEPGLPTSTAQSAGRAAREPALSIFVLLCPPQCAFPLI